MHTIMELHEKLGYRSLIVQSCRAAAIALVALGTTAACSGSDDTSTTYPPPPECDAGKNCVSTGAVMTGSGGAGGQGGSGGSGGQQGVTVTGEVEEITDPLFKISQPYLGAATILVDGTEAMAVWDGSMFSVPNVPAGPQWFYVRDDTAGTSGILSTYSSVDVSGPGPITLPVIQTQMFEGIANTLPVPKSLVMDQAQIVLQVLRNTQPLSGVHLDMPPVPDDDVAYYDSTMGGYSNLATVTDTNGTILIFNAPTADAILTVQLVDANQTAFPNINIRVGANAVTMVAVSL